jgi:hypothetical protein
MGPILFAALLDQEIITAIVHLIHEILKVLLLTVVAGDGDHARHDGIWLRFAPNRTLNWKIAL